MNSYHTKKSESKTIYMLNPPEPEMRNLIWTKYMYFLLFLHELKYRIKTHQLLNFFIEIKTIIVLVVVNSIHVKGNFYNSMHAV